MLKGEVVLFHDTFNNFNTPNVAVAATRFLGTVRVIEFCSSTRKCCGRPMISKGMLSQAKENAAWNVDKLAPYAEKGTPIVGLEPSCLLTLRDEYPGVHSDRCREEKLADASFLLEEFVARERKRAGRLKLESSGNGKKVLLHGHCHQKALVGTAPTIAMLKAAGYDVSEVDSGCCGMAGSFGFEKEHYDLSTKDRQPADWYHR